MARASSLKVGDCVDYGGKVCTVIAIYNKSEVIAVQYSDNKGFIAYTYAKQCKKIA